MSQHARSHPELYEEQEPTHVAQCYHRLRGNRCDLSYPHPDELHCFFKGTLGQDVLWDDAESDGARK
jgi:hypothetical protein